MNLQIGDLYEYQGWDKEGLNVLCVYRGKSFSPNFEWFDFFLRRPSDDYIHNGFHVDSSGTKRLKFIMHLPDVAPVRWAHDEKGIWRKNEVQRAEEPCSSPEI